MIYELRVYRAVPGRMPDLLKRFENHTLKFWQEQGIRQVGFWTTTIGASNQELFYILAWESLEERQRKRSLRSGSRGCSSGGGGNGGLR